MYLTIIIAMIKQKPIEEKQANLSAKTPGAGDPIFTKGKIVPQKSKVEKSRNLFLNL